MSLVPRYDGCYVIKSAESRPLRVEELKRRAAGRPAPLPAVVTDADRALVRAILARRRAA